tara:strand:- start:2225 stop:2338 length:114 start_codon:yes stop_codon:yes gene_type:complete
MKTPIIYNIEKYGMYLEYFKSMIEKKQSKKPLISYEN